MFNILGIMALLVTMIKCDELKRLQTEFETQINTDNLHHVALIDQIDNILIELLSQDEPRLNLSRQILSKQKADIKEIKLEALNAINTYILQLNSIIIESQKERNQQRVKRNTNEVSRLGLNYILNVIKIKDSNFRKLMSSVISLEIELENELMNDEQALHEAKEIVEKMKDMFKTYHNKVVHTTHKAKHDLDEIIHFLNKNDQSDNVEKEQASYIKSLLGIFEQQKNEENAAVREELKKLKPQIEDLHKQLKIKDERIEKFLERDGQLNELEKQNNKMKGQLAQKQQDIERLDKEVQQLKQENEFKTKEMTRLNADISRLSQTTTPRSTTKPSVRKPNIVYPDDPEDF